MLCETNSLINESRHGSDDGCDYTSCIIDRWHGAARARCRAPHTPPVLPTRVSAAARESMPLVKIGSRPNYGRTILIGLYQLHLLGNNDKQIAKKLCMSCQKVTHLMKHNTRMREEVYRQALSSPLPAETEIMRRLAAESMP